MKYTQLLMIPIFLNMACSDLKIQNFEEGSSEKLLQGQRTSERPEVVRLRLSNGGFCTGTVIKSNIVLTAAHCIGYQSAAIKMGAIITDNDREYEVQGGFSFDQGLGANDVALLHLSRHIPESEITPAVIHAGLPTHGSNATIYGYGCNNRRTQRGDLLYQKQKFSYKVGERTGNLCPGDSGGPVFVNNAVAYVNSAYYTRSGDDIFAEPSSFHEEVNIAARQIAAQGIAQYINQKADGEEQSLDNESNHNSQGNDDTTNSSDECELYGYYGDGQCDPQCSQPDPDCTQQQGQEDGSSMQSDDQCELYGYYGDGECDFFCHQPDPDCAQQQEQEDGSSMQSDDECELYGYYGDGQCDPQCSQPDPDCAQQQEDGGSMQSDDECELYGYYGDGECDFFCHQPDPDCY